MFLGGLIIKLAAGSVLIEILLILSFSPLHAEVQAIAVAEGAGTLETLLGTVFPYLWMFLIIAFFGVIVYDLVLKK